MGDAAKRAEERRIRSNERVQRLLDAQDRQKAADLQTYGEGSALLPDRSSAGGNKRGGIWDISTDNYQQPPANQYGQNNSVNDGNGIDSIGAGSDVTVASSGGTGLPDGYGPEAYTVCVNGAPVTRNFLTDNPD